MSLERIKDNFLRLPRYYQLRAFGALILAISPFLPWYADIDAYRVGDLFLGITGPGSFVGLAILVLSGFSLWLSTYPLRARPTPRLPLKESLAHLFVAGESLFLLLIVNSIFFHPKFGVNITLKESRFGMTVAFVGALLMLVGAYMQTRGEKQGDDIGKLEPLIKIHKPMDLDEEPMIQDRPHSTINPPAPERPREGTPQASQLRGFGFEDPNRPQ